jgi:hypothetical protein
MSRLLIALLFLIPQDTLQVKVSLVTVGVRVTDSRDRDVRGLKAENFSVFDDGVQQKIEFFSEMEQPITLGIVLDRSNSMQYNDKLDRAKEAALTLLRSTREGSEYFYIAFDDGVKVAADFTTDRHQIESAIQETKLGGGTSLYDAILKGIELTNKGQLSRQALVIISDGTDQHSRRRLADVLKTVRQSKIQAYTIGYFSGSEEALFRRSGSRVELIDGTLIDRRRTSLPPTARHRTGRTIRRPRASRLWRAARTRLANGPISKGRNPRSGGNRDDPCPYDAASNAPFDGRYPPRGAYTDNGACNRVRGADWNSAPGRADDADRAGGFRAEAAHRPQQGNLLSHCPDDFPAARKRTKANRGVRHQYDPKRNTECLEVSGRKQYARDDAHRLLGVICAVADTEQGGGKELKFPKKFVDV